MDRCLSLDDLRCLLGNYAVSKLPIGIIGFGAFGKQIKQILTLWNMETEVCDPPLAENESEEEMDSLMELWGNGMGGCCYSGSEKEIFLPFQTLCKNCSALIFCLPDSFPESARFKYKDFANLKHAPVLINFSGDFIWQKKDMQTLKDDTIISDYITASLLI